MNQFKFLAFFILALHLFQLNAFAADSKDSREKRSAGLIDVFTFEDMPEDIQGCSCLFHTDSSEHLIFASDMRNEIWMKIEGKFILLKLKESKFGEIGHMMTKAVGQKLEYVYSGDGTDVNIQITSTSACPPESEGCEGQSFDGIFTATKGNKRQTIRASGNCGC